MTMENLVGTYKLLSWEIRHESGEKSYPFGTDVQGMISYTEDGYIFAHIMAANRKAYSGGDLFGGETSEIVEGANTHISYCGTYQTDGDEIIHNVYICSFPNWVSTEQRRHFEFDKGNLLLSVQDFHMENERVGSYLIWQPTDNRNAI